jgi:CBS domain-containing protein
MSEQIIDEELAIVAERTVPPNGPVIDRQTLRQPIHVLTPRPPLVTTADAPLRDAVQLMRDHRVGCALVVDGSGRLVGIVTERDLLLKLDAATELSRPVGDLMTGDPETLSADDPIAYALNRMADGGYRHVPLVDADGRPTGMVSVKDVVHYLADSFPATVFTAPPVSKHAAWRGRYGA